MTRSCENCRAAELGASDAAGPESLRHLESLEIRDNTVCVWAQIFWRLDWPQPLSAVLGSRSITVFVIDEAIGRFFVVLRVADNGVLIGHRRRLIIDKNDLRSGVGG